MTYQPAVYRKQGGDELVVASSGIITIESGGICKLPVQVLGTSQVATNVVEFGYTSLVASTTGPTYTLAGPTAVGLWKYIRIESNTSSGTANVNTSSTGVSVSSTNGNQLQFNAVDDSVVLVSETTGKWRIVANTGSVTKASRST